MAELAPPDVAVTPGPPLRWVYHGLPTSDGQTYQIGILGALHLCLHVCFLLVLPRLFSGSLSSFTSALALTIHSVYHFPAGFVLLFLPDSDSDSADNGVHHDIWTACRGRVAAGSVDQGRQRQPNCRGWKGKDKEGDCRALGLRVGTTLNSLANTLGRSRPHDRSHHMSHRSIRNPRIFDGIEICQVGGERQPCIQRLAPADVV